MITLELQVLRCDRAADVVAIQKFNIINSKSAIQTLIHPGANRGSKTERTSEKPEIQS